MRFYGHTPRVWREEMAVADVQRCLAAIPRLQAQESLQAVTCLLVGTRPLRRGVASSIIRRWTRAASAGQPKRRPRGPANPARLAALGIHIAPPEMP